MLREGDVVVFAGDSITEYGRAPVSGRSGEVPLGTGYVYYVDKLIKALAPGLKVRIINAGISGNTVFDLLVRWDDDVLAYRPSLVSLLIGVNDAHRFLSGQTEYSPQEFERAYRSLVEKTLASEAKMLLLTPFYVTRAAEGPRRKALEVVGQYAAAVAKIAKDYGLEYIDLYTKFKELAERGEPVEYSYDAIHPTITGSIVIAVEVVKRLLGGI
ncbi:MAG: SGNH/GDSL hydrolase family protein [Thermoproteus sp. AZ2]|jgi:lysophospholipase L1-like esterase|uniref:SGNH/GDSL hydrolase family protein n=1 Tax=Thermoproteus sp. AZ2 TaxID=1609232 RepID=A0ACC6V3H3_9CREN